jgi:hypothetical protein
MAKKAADDQPTSQPKMTKTDAVKAALAEGVDKPEDGVAFIRDRFGLEVTNAQFSTYKSLAKAKGAAKRGRKGARKGHEERSTPKGHTVGNGLVAVDDLEAVKGLVAKIGADQVKRIAGLFE